MTVYFLGAKGFCTYACPYGGFFGVADKLAPGRIRVTDACNECGHCTAVCTSNVIVHREVKEFGMVVDPGCMKCMDCVSVCPNDALYFGFGRPSIGISTKKVAKNFSLTWPEELGAAAVFFLSFMAVWGRLSAGADANGSRHRVCYNISNGSGVANTAVTRSGVLQVGAQGWRPCAAGRLDLPCVSRFFGLGLTCTAASFVITSERARSPFRMSKYRMNSRSPHPSQANG